MGAESIRRAVERSARDASQEARGDRDNAMERVLSLRSFIQIPLRSAMSVATPARSPDVELPEDFEVGSPWRKLLVLTHPRPSRSGDCLFATWRALSVLRDRDDRSDPNLRLQCSAAKLDGFPQESERLARRFVSSEYRSPDQ